MPPTSDEDLERLYPAIGELVLAWGQLESGLEYIIAIVYHRTGGKHHTDTKVAGLPRQWRRKRDFLRRCFKSIDLLSPHKDRALTLLDRLAPIEKVRNEIIHGALHHFDPETSRYHFRSLEIDEALDTHRPTGSQITLAKLIVTVDACHDLAGEFLDLANGLSEAFMPESELQKIARKYGFWKL